MTSEFASILARKESFMAAIDLFVQAEALKTNDSQCKLLCHRELVRAYRQMREISGMKQI